MQLGTEDAVAVVETPEEEGADEGEIRIRSHCPHLLRNQCPELRLHTSDRWLYRVQYRPPETPRTFPQDPRPRKRSLLDPDQQQIRPP